MTWRQGTKGPLRARLRGAARAGGGRAGGAHARAQQPAPAGRGGLAGGRAALARASASTTSPTCRAGTGLKRLAGDHQGPLGVRAGASAAQGGARASTTSRGAPGRGLHRHALDDADRLLPSCSTDGSRPAKRGETSRTDRRPSRACQRSGEPFFSTSPMRWADDVPSAKPGSPSTRHLTCQGSARRV